MATTEGNAAASDAMAPDGLNEVVSTERNSVVIEAPKPADPGPVESEADKMRATIDRMGNELGEARRLLKEQSEQLAALATPKAPEEAPVSFEDNPQAFIEQTIQRTLEANLAPKLQVLESDLLNRQSVKFDELLSETYPNWRETIQEDTFASWVKASPARAQMYRTADSQFDVDSAVELLRMYKRDQAEAESAKAGAIGAAGLVEASGDTGGARTYAASEISRMVTDDPEGYRRFMAGDGMKAYQEGRVDRNR